MNLKTAVEFQLRRTHERVQQCVADLSAEEARRSPLPQLSPAVWQVGHLAFYDTVYAEQAGVGVTPSPIPEDYERLFKAGSGGAAEYPPIDEVQKAFDRTNAALLRVAASADLARPVEGQLYKDVGGMLIFACVHRSYHIGKLATLRAMLDKPVLFGPPGPASGAARR